jgi:hypothetical protein
MPGGWIDGQIQDLRPAQEKVRHREGPSRIEGGSSLMMGGRHPPVATEEIVPLGPRATPPSKSAQIARFPPTPPEGVGRI